MTHDKFSEKFLKQQRDIDKKYVSNVMIRRRSCYCSKCGPLSTLEMNM